MAPAATRSSTGRPVAMSEDRQRITIFKNIARGAVPHKPNANIADALARHVETSPKFVRLLAFFARLGVQPAYGDHLW